MSPTIPGHTSRQQIRDPETIFVLVPKVQGSAELDARLEGGHVYEREVEAVLLDAADFRE